MLDDLSSIHLTRVCITEMLLQLALVFKIPVELHVLNESGDLYYSFLVRC